MRRFFPPRDAAPAPRPRDRAPALLELRGLAFAQGRREVLRGVDLRVEAREIVALLGANGAGKSTLFRLLLGLAAPQGGEIFLGGAPLAALRRTEIARRVAFTPQGHVATFPYRVLDVVLLGRLPHGGLMRAPDAKDREAAEAAMARLKIAHLSARPYTEISGGERQLALIARALAQGAPLLVMDEPMTGLDYGYQRRMLDLMAELAETGVAVLFSTHHPDHALAVASRVAVLHEGRIVDDDAPAAVITPAMLERVYGVAPRRAPEAVREHRAAS